MTRRQVNACLAAILFCQALLGFLYLRKTAIFNAPDEPYHFNYVAFLARRRRLPIADGSRALSEAIQPPLYYASALPLYCLTKSWPLAWRVRALRAQNLCYALLNVWLIFLLIREISGEKTALLGAAFAALLPQFLFIGASVSNDPLADLLASAALYGGLKLIKSPGSWRWLIFEGLAVGLGFSAKLSVACCAAAVAAICLWRGLKGARSAAGQAACAAGLAAGVGGWPLWRNALLYGDIAGERAMFRESAMRWQELGGWCVKMFESFWGLFAWMASPLPRDAYLALMSVTLAVAAGFFLWARDLDDGWRKPGVALMLLAAGLALAQAFYQGFLHARQPQGRYLFPALGPWAFIFASGAAELWRRMPRRLRPALAAAALLGEVVLQMVSLRAL